MRYLFDVSSLLALGVKEHQFRPRVSKWLLSLAAIETPQLATCSITELGFVRIASQVAEYGFTVEQAREELSNLKISKNYDFAFIADGNDVSNLPDWVKLSKHTTDGHLAELAKAHGCTLATFDENIPGSFVIP